MGRQVITRRRGVKWNEIVDAIARHFAIKPPTERQMRKWYQEYGVDASDPEKLLKENLIKVARATTPIAAFATQKYAIEQVLSMLEQTVGTEKFNQLLEEYQKSRTGCIAPGMAEGNLKPEPEKE